MIQNYLIIGLRQLWKHKFFSTINIIGLSVGLSTCTLLLLYVQHELSFDRFHQNADRIYRVFFDSKVQGQVMKEATVMPPLAQAMRSDFPEVADATRIRTAGKQTVIHQDKKFREIELAYVDFNFFQFFSFPLLKGDAGKILTDPNTVVILETVAQRLFGTREPVGQVIQPDGWAAPCTVEGVMADMPVNSHFKADILVSQASNPEAASDSWMVSNYFTYILLNNADDAASLSAKLPGLVDRYIGPQMQNAMGITLADFRNNGSALNFQVQPLKDIHFSSGFPADLSPSGNQQHVFACIAIAAFILLIACINFMNLSTATATGKIKEAGIRKAIGSGKSALVGQFFTETLLLTGVSLLVSVGLIALALPLFNHLTEQHFSLDILTSPLVLFGLAGVALLTAVLSGIYPAVFIANTQPVKALKGVSDTTASRKLVRSGLVVFQFFISALLILSTLVVYHQLSYILQKDLGYNMDQVLILPGKNEIGPKAVAFEQLLRQHPAVKLISESGYLPAGNSFGNNFFVTADQAQGAMVKTLRYDVDEQYIPALGMQMAQGRNFSKEQVSDSSAIIINETAARELGYSGDPLGKSVLYNNKSGNTERFTVIGVVKDFHFRPLHEPIAPLVMLRRSGGGNTIVKVNAAGMQGLLGTVSEWWRSNNGDTPLEYSFLDDRFRQTYASDQRTGVLLGIFAGISIFIACLGLFGLAVYTAVQRTKEIGVRKVLGASVQSIVFLLSKDFIRLVLLALVLAAPVATWLMQRWLSDYAYHVQVEWWIYGATGVLAIAIAFITVGGHAFKAALADPVKSIRND